MEARHSRRDSRVRVGNCLTLGVAITWTFGAVSVRNLMVRPIAATRCASSMVTGRSVVSRTVRHWTPPYSEPSRPPIPLEAGHRFRSEGGRFLGLRWNRRPASFVAARRTRFDAG